MTPQDKRYLEETVKPFFDRELPQLYQDMAAMEKQLKALGKKPAKKGKK